eukprot:6638094-Ditylum_brightwellii.AAC.1
MESKMQGQSKDVEKNLQKDRVLKELVESVPIMHNVMLYVQSYSSLDSADENGDGKGYLSMFLSELLPPEKVEKFILVDKAWARCNTREGLQSHHINWDHIYANVTAPELELTSEIESSAE